MVVRVGIDGEKTRGSERREEQTGTGQRNSIRPCDAWEERNERAGGDLMAEGVKGEIGEWIGRRDCKNGREKRCEQE